MKQYLKMADVFGADEVTEQKLVGDSYELKSDSYGHVCVVNTSSRASLIAHAINSHDELVQMNQELLAALEQVVGDVRALANQSYGVHGLHQNGDLAPWGSLFAGGFFESWLLSVDDADAVIAKAKGGAA